MRPPTDSGRSTSAGAALSGDGSASPVGDSSATGPSRGWSVASPSASAGAATSPEAGTCSRGLEVTSLEERREETTRRMTIPMTTAIASAMTIAQGV